MKRILFVLCFVLGGLNLNFAYEIRGGGQNIQTNKYYLNGSTVVWTDADKAAIQTADPTIPDTSFILAVVPPVDASIIQELKNEDVQSDIKDKLRDRKTKSYNQTKIIKIVNDISNLILVNTLTNGTISVSTTTLSNSLNAYLSRYTVGN